MSLGGRKRRQVGRHETQVEGELGHELAGAVDDPGPARKAPTLFSVAAQVRERGRAEPALHLFEAAPGTDRREHARARKVTRRGVVHVVGRDDGDVGTHRELGQRVVARHVVGLAVVPDLYREVLAPEALDELGETTPRGARAFVEERACKGSLATSRQHQPLLRCISDLIQREARRALFAPLEVREREHARESRVSLGRAREQHEVLTRGVRDPDAIVPCVEGDFRSKDAREPEGARRFGESHDAVEAVVIAERKAREP